MSTRRERAIKRIRSGDYLAEVEVEFCCDDDKDYSPTLSLQDALRVERVFKDLERGDIDAAAREATIYRLTPISTA